MKFSFSRVVLWLSSGNRRELVFEPNKVNVITGYSGTGKTSIEAIIDYCLFSSSVNIPEGVINENVEWYGVVFDINDKKYTVARKKIIENSVSDEYYFSSTGEVPDSILPNNTEQVLKGILETEFGIDQNVKIPFGGGIIKTGSKISFRYFLMFNTISGNIIENDSGLFFDKQSNRRYREALPRIFDLALGIETVENVLKKEKRAELERDLAKWRRKQRTFEGKADDFHEEQVELVKKAKQFSIIEADLNMDDSMASLKVIYNEDTVDGLLDRVDYVALQSEKLLLERKIQNLERFQKEHKSYKTRLKKVQDSLKPISFIRENEGEILKTSIFEEMIDYIERDLNTIKSSVRSQTPMDKQVRDITASYSDRIKEIDSEIESVPDHISAFKSEKAKQRFLGEVKTKIELYASESSGMTEECQKCITRIESELSELQVNDVKEKKEMTVRLLEEIISEYMSRCQDPLGNYGSYVPVFDYKEKQLSLRKPKTTYIEKVGSSSNHMFMHLFFSLSMHDAIFYNKAPYVPPFLIIDQPSRPYYGSESGGTKEELDQSDELKIRSAFKLLNDYISDRREAGGEFQMIVFEHVPSVTWEGMENVHLAEDFFKDVLIPLDEIN